MSHLMSLSGVLRVLGSSSVNYANKIGHLLDCLLPRKWRWEAHGKQPGDPVLSCGLFIVKVEFGLVFFLFSFGLTRSFDLGDTGLRYYFAIFGYFTSMERFCLIERKTDWYRTDFFIVCAHGWILQRFVQYGVKSVKN